MMAFILKKDRLLGVKVLSLNYGNDGMFLMMGNAGFISSTVVFGTYPKP